MTTPTHPDDEPLELTTGNRSLVVHGPRYQIDTPDGTLEGLTNLDLTTPFGKACLVNAGSRSDVDYDQHGVVRFKAVAYVLFPDEGADPETGEERHFTRSVLFDQAGNLYSTTSDYAPRRLKAAFSLYTPAQWAEGIPFVIRQRRGKSGRTWHDLRVEVQP